MAAILLLGSLLGGACVGLDKLTPPAREPPEGATLGGLEISANAVEFGEVVVGWSTEQDILLTNGGADPIALTAELDDAGAFTASTTALDVTGESVITLGFAPTAGVAYEGSLTLSITGGDTLVLPVTGAGRVEAADDTGDTEDDTGPAPAGAHIEVSPGSHDFGLIDVGDVATTSLVVSNEGTEDLLVRDVVASHAVFTFDGTLAPPQIIAPGSTKTLEVSFEPDAESSWRGSVTLSSDDPRTPAYVVTVSGQGVVRCDACAPFLDVDTGGDPNAITDFFSVQGSTDARTITLQNVGDMDLVVADVVVNNDTLAACGGFRVTRRSGSTTLAPWSSESFDIEYTTSESCLDVPQAGFDANVLHIYSNDPSTADWVIELGGAGFWL